MAHRLIYMKRGDVDLITVKPDDGSVETERVMGAQQLTVTFRLNSYIAFMVGDHTTLFGKRYNLNYLPTVTEEAGNFWNYTMVLESEMYDMTKAMHLFLGADNTLKEPNFSLMATAQRHLELLIQNLDRVFGNGYFTLGQVIPTEAKNITFQFENCHQALAHIAEEFGTEWAVEGRVIHLTKRVRGTAIQLKVGRYKGLYSVTRTNVNNSRLVTRLYVYGGEKNIPPNYRNGSKYLLPDAGLMNNLPYLEKNVDKYGIIEGYIQNEDIYPRLTDGVVGWTSATDLNWFGAECLDGLNPLDTQYHVDGATPQIVFNTGELAGFTFNIADYGKPAGAPMGSSKGVWLTPIQEMGQTLPNASLKIQAGDQFVILGISLPPIYVTIGEQLLYQWALEQMENHLAEPQVAYSVILDPTYLKNHNIIPRIGDIVWIYDAQLQLSRQIRVVQTIRSLTNDWQITMEIADIVPVETVQRLEATGTINTRDLRGLEQAVRESPIFNNQVNGTLTFQGMPQGTGKAVYLDSNGRLVHSA